MTMLWAWLGVLLVGMEPHSVTDTAAADAAAALGSDTQSSQS